MILDGYNKASENATHLRLRHRRRNLDIENNGMQPTSNCGLEERKTPRKSLLFQFIPIFGFSSNDVLQSPPVKHIFID